MAGSKRDASVMDAGDGSTDLQEVGTPRQQGGVHGKAPRVEYARQYPAREIVPERRAEATGPDRPKRKRMRRKGVLRELGRRGEAEVRRDGLAAGTAAGMRPSIQTP